jgi:hypothetical protein
VFAEMRMANVNPGSENVALLLEGKLCAKWDDPDVARGIFQYWVGKNFNPTKKQAGCRKFDKLVILNYFQTLNRHGLSDQVLETESLLRERNANFLLDENKYIGVQLVVAHSKKEKGGGSIAAAEFVGNYVKKSKRRNVDVAIFNVLIFECAAHNDIETAQNAFLQIRQLSLIPNDRTYGPYLSLLCKHGTTLRVLEKFEDNLEMSTLRGGSHKISIKTALPFNVLLHECREPTDLQLADRILRLMENQGIAPDRVTVSTCVELFGNTTVVAEIFRLGENGLLSFDTNIDVSSLSLSDYKIRTESFNGSKRPLVDLHGMSAAEARIATLQMLDLLARKGTDWGDKNDIGDGLLIITGTGSELKLSSVVRSLLDDLNVLYKYSKSINAGRIFIPEHGLRRYNVQQGNETLNNVLFRNTMVRYSGLFGVLFAAAYVIPKVADFV